jgi:hypothetical protein
MDRKEYNKQYYEKNKEKRIQQSLNYYHNHRTPESIERKKEYDRKYHIYTKNKIKLERSNIFEIKRNVKVRFD